MNPFWQAYFSDGLKPPISFVCFFFTGSEPVGRVVAVMMQPWLSKFVLNHLLFLGVYTDSSCRRTGPQAGCFLFKRYMKIQIGIFCTISQKPGHEQFKTLGFVLRCFFLGIVTWLDFHMNLKPPFERVFLHIFAVCIVQKQIEEWGWFSKPQNFDLGKRLISCWFQIFSIFTPILGEDSHFDSYFSNGLVQPPSRRSCATKNVAPAGRPYYLAGPIGSFVGGEWFSS